MKSYDKEESAEVLNLILNDDYNTSRPIHLVAEELVGVIRFLSELMALKGSLHPPLPKGRGFLAKFFMKAKKNEECEENEFWA